MAIVCDHEITHTSYATCRGMIFIYRYIKLYGPFLLMGCNCVKTRQSHYAQSVYFLPEIPGTHWINIREMKGRDDLKAMQWF